VNAVDAFSSIITQDAYNVARFFNADFDIRLSNLLKRQKFDIVHLESLFMTPYIGTIRRYSRAPIVLRSHNLEHIIWERMSMAEPNLIKRIYLRYLSRKLRSYEQANMHDVSGIVAISATDHARYLELGCQAPLLTIPFGIDTEHYANSGTGTVSASFFHIGAMDWQPNREAIEWLLAEVWPKVQDQCTAELHLAGRALAADFTKAKGVVVQGEVDSAVAFMHAHTIMVVPLRSGGGIRVKIIEAMAAGKAIVTTSVGAEGIGGTNGEHYIVADTADAFADAMCSLAANPARVAHIGALAKRFAAENFDNRKLTERLVDFYEHLIAKRK
jgi:glycosyltransferase involved in cell wall biosynthesis